MKQRFILIILFIWIFNSCYYIRETKGNKISSEVVGEDTYEYIYITGPEPKITFKGSKFVIETGIKAEKIKVKKEDSKVTYELIRKPELTDDMCQKAMGFCIFLFPIPLTILLFESFTIPFRSIDSTRVMLEDAKSVISREPLNLASLNKDISFKVENNLLFYAKEFDSPPSKIEVDLNSQGMDFYEVRRLRDEDNKVKSYCSYFRMNLKENGKERLSGIEGCPSLNFVQEFEKKNKNKCLARHERFLATLTQYYNRMQVDNNTYTTYCTSKSGIDRNKYLNCLDEVRDCFDIIRL
ncbi:hypothetical protein [Leptospira stimsonii]|uniref:Uncharacterized protein n=1 Tax=Leptospira stimsonii TaxID=2202203 RepID=A0A396YLG0_9LEPT|nr:hypothetical protein [Leptospira stimsonii]RHX83919.1 hypothetical protein DLM75_23530 [Leptospira stimsonii]